MCSRWMKEKEEKGRREKMMEDREKEDVGSDKASHLYPLQGRHLISRENTNKRKVTLQGSVIEPFYPNLPLPVIFGHYSGPGLQKQFNNRLGVGDAIALISKN